MTPALQALYDDSVGLAMDRQSHLLTLLQEVQWTFDMALGVIEFQTANDRWVVPCQVLGTESDAGQSWLWGWANPASGIPGPLLDSARALQRLGTANAIPELTDPSSRLADVDGHLLATIASATHTNCCGYYRTPYDGGALYVLLFSDDLAEKTTTPLVRLAAGWSRTLAAVGETITDHPRAIRAYSRALGLDTRDVTQGLHVTGPGGSAHVLFDSEGRTEVIEVRAGPEFET